MSFDSINPYNGEKMTSYKELNADETVAAVESAHEVFQSWRTTTFDDRKQILKAFAEELRSRKDEFAKLITLEMGKRIEESRSEIDFCADIVDFYADGAEEFLADHEMETDTGDAYIQYQPLGVLLGVMPWNFPFYQVVRFASPNLMAGNVVMVKHASNVPQCAKAIEDLFKKVGLPDNAYTNLFIPTEFVNSIIDHDAVQGVSLTGSDAAGSAVAERAGKQIKKSVLELGGNDAFIVLDDADLESTIESAVKGRMQNTGQSCVASKRFIVLESVADEFMNGFKKAMSELKMGDPMDPETDMGPLSTESAAADLLEKVQSTINAGAKVVLGGDRPDSKGAFFNPTILTEITSDMPTYDQELFGPVASVYVVKDEQAAIELANDSSYGLGGSVYTQDIDRGRRVAEQVQTGMMFINQPTNSQEELPFGGIKKSGYGRELSKLGILEFVNKKLVHAPAMA
ncbi:NAD-dependent succinate-semialdehyde dehydrogenase [Mariniblastus fucicola]|uniref:Succinate-semialdehyde dehydrogenase [NADP(+)] 1 n=1 Tax=Mariniblastus fucicola TaxID=980251 RepID=A0A5B9PD30_9BACT|nr:NAD-dependent succinate-semialdehyde dehydrogenase [Mariniblastus fucicola]QEG23085.1 Succinate-semialdehyde dehydrogenase [NADP(+)] 1 [Mariniblastus fucicola]